MRASLDGITMLPAGHIAAIKTYLECMALPEAIGSASAADDVELERLTGAHTPRYRAVFAALGQRWLWWSRLQMPETALASLLDDPSVEAYAVVEHGSDIGLLEWDFRQSEAPELAFLGLTASGMGRGLGSHLIRVTFQRMFDQPIRAVRVNTCTFDSPAALALYRRCGFVPVAQAVEIVPDPRRTGLLPADAAPHVPMLPPL